VVLLGRAIKRIGVEEGKEGSAIRKREWNEAFSVFKRWDVRVKSSM
jgi:hypothetical protein